MIAREWKARVPSKYKKGFINYLYETGIKDTSSLKGYKGSQILTRDLKDKTEIIFISYWDSLESIKTFVGEDIDIAKLYPEDYKYKLEPDSFVSHYEVVENNFIKQ